MIAIIGAGRWGQNLIRNFNALGALSVICDSDTNKLNAISAVYPQLETTTSFEEMLTNPKIQGVVIATPASTHEKLAQMALKANKHVYVEKPLARSTYDAKVLMNLAEKLDLILMVGHLLIYHPAVNKLKELIEQGELGEIRFLNSDRRNLVHYPSDTNVMWDLAPHDISMIGHLLNSQTIDIINATGFITSDNKVVDIAHLDLEFDNKIKAHIHNSWIDPQKQCLLTVNGTKKTAVLNDAQSDQKLKLYSINKNDDTLTVEIPAYAQSEPLYIECRHFLECINNGNKPKTDAWNGFQIVEALENAETSMKYLNY